jgi:hypothetical protein
MEVSGLCGVVCCKRKKLVEKDMIRGANWNSHGVDVVGDAPSWQTNML